MRKDVWGKGTALSGAMAVLMLGAAGGPNKAQSNDVGYVERFGEGNFYVGLNYSPAFSRITGFEIRESTGETAAVYPYDKNGKRVEWKANNFDWNTPDPKIRFKDNPIVALEGSVGYSIGSARVELEIGYEQFKTKGIRDTGTKEEEADTVYLLAKKLPHTLVSDQNDEFKKLLAQTEAKEIAAFAQAVGTQATEIDTEVCAKKKVRSNSSSATDNVTENGRWSCVDSSGGNGGTHRDVAPGKTKTFSWRFSDINKHDRKTDGGSSSEQNNKGWPSTGAKANDTSDAMAEDIGKLQRPEKAKVAGLLSKTISGAEVVEIRAVSTTSVMLNACYDLQSEGFSIVPYACLGVGANFVGIVDGAVTPKLAYKVKAGLSYALSPEISVFAGGFYHRILGEGEYDDLPVQKLVDDQTTNKTKEFAKASFKMAYTGAEIGIRFAF